MLEDAPERKNVQRSLYISLPGRLWLPRELLEAVLTLPGWIRLVWTAVAILLLPNFS